MKTPSFKLPGGKTRLRNWLMQMMPREGGLYLEPFAGRGNVFWLAARCLRFDDWWLNDILSAPFFRAILEVDLSEIPLRISHAQVLGVAQRARKGLCSLDLILQTEVCFSGRVMDGSGSVAGWIAGYKGENLRKRVAAARRVLQASGATITDCHQKDLDLRELDGNDFVYLDPPYLNYKGHSTAYTGHEHHFTDLDHIAMLKALRAAPYRWILSGIESEMYRDILEAPAATRNARRTMLMGAHEHIVEECVWTGGL